MKHVLALTILSASLICGLAAKADFADFYVVKDGTYSNFKVTPWDDPDTGCRYLAFTTQSMNGGAHMVPRMKNAYPNTYGSHHWCDDQYKRK